MFRSIKRLRNRLEEYIRRNPEFARSLSPLSELHETASSASPDSRVPECARRMHRASLLTGVGPMAAVAGTFSQMAVESILDSASFPFGGSFSRPTTIECIVENGGDIFAILTEPLTVGLWVGKDSPFRELGFTIPPEETPLAVCSSSSRMGHSYSAGSCDLVTVFSTDASLADACATAVCNRIKTYSDIEAAIQWGVAIKGIDGILAIKDDKIGMAGNLPQLHRHTDLELQSKITRHPDSSL